MIEKPNSASVSSSIPICVSMPLQPASLGFAAYGSTQVALICTFDSADRSGNAAYLVRILTDATRMQVDMARHSSPTSYAAAGLLYDHAYNVIYWTLFQTWSTPYSHATERKTVHRVVLYPDYDINYVEARPAFNSSSPSSQHPLGLSLEAASIEPSANGNQIYAYLCHMGNRARLYKITRGNLNRNTSFAPLDSTDGPVLRSIEVINSTQCILPAKFFFTLHGRLFWQQPYSGPVTGSDHVFMAGNCQKCPNGLTSIGGQAVSVDMCRYCNFLSNSFFIEQQFCVPHLNGVAGVQKIFS